jgi:hypothetical protein
MLLNSLAKYNSLKTKPLIQYFISYEKLASYDVAGCDIQL